MKKSIKKALKISFMPRLRQSYFFGYGADREVDMIRAITGRKPRVIGTATLNGYELRVQKLSEITDKGHGGTNPREVLLNSWGGAFKSYVIVPNPEKSVSGCLFRISLKDRNLVDKWELVHMGWYDKVFVNIRLDKKWEHLSC